MPAAIAVPKSAGQDPVPCRVLNVPGSRPYASGRYASPVPAWSERVQPGGPGADLTQQAQQLDGPEGRKQLMRQQARPHSQQAQHAQHAQQQEAVAGALPQGVTFQAPPGAPVSGEDAPSLSAPAQVRAALSVGCDLASCVAPLFSGTEHVGDEYCASRPFSIIPQAGRLPDPVLNRSLYHTTCKTAQRIAPFKRSHIILRFNVHQHVGAVESASRRG